MPFHLASFVHPYKSARTILHQKSDSRSSVIICTVSSDLNTIILGTPTIRYATRPPERSLNYLPRVKFHLRTTRPQAHSNGVRRVADSDYPS